MLNSDEIVLTKEDILAGINKYNSIDSKEVAAITEILESVPERKKRK